MRKWMMIIGAVFLTLIGLATLAFLNLNSLINYQKDYLLSQAEAALGREIMVKEIEVTVWGG
ncbi:MAG: hypothetical protein ACREQ3_05920, partial [Candidatus Binatia bacterium]